MVVEIDAAADKCENCMQEGGLELETKDAMLITTNEVLEICVTHKEDNTHIRVHKDLE